MEQIVTVVMIGGLIVFAGILVRAMVLNSRSAYRKGRSRDTGTSTSYAHNDGTAGYYDGSSSSDDGRGSSGDSGGSFWGGDSGSSWGGGDSGGGSWGGGGDSGGSSGS
ncbi:MAG TPA: hypothetical protein VN408_31450 [Actinoplanes sp.]|nr:hypothetical protein [Actinoplanes sp.]